MKTNVTFTDFTDAFRNMGRKDQFSYNGLKALYDYLEELENDMNEEIELDVIAFCCEYTEYENLAEYNQEHDYVESLAQVQELTQVIVIDTEAFIIQQF